MAKESHKPTERSRQRVYDLSSFGIPQTDICEDLEISEKTLRKHYKKELKKAKHELIILAGGVLRDSLLEKNVGSAYFTLKTRAGWRETEAKQQINNVNIHEEFVKSLSKEKK